MPIVKLPKTSSAPSNLILKRVIANYLLTSVDYPLEVDSTLGPVTITLPAANALGDEFRIAWIAGAFPVTITSSNTVARPVERPDGSAGTSALMSGIGEVWDFYISQNRFKRT
jgi:hypothetical protein